MPNEDFFVSSCGAVPRVLNQGFHESEVTGCWTGALFCSLLLPGLRYLLCHVLSWPLSQPQELDYFAAQQNSPCQWGRAILVSGKFLNARSTEECFIFWGGLNCWAPSSDLGPGELEMGIPGSVCVCVCARVSARARWVYGGGRREGERWEDSYSPQASGFYL